MRISWLFTALLGFCCLGTLDAQTETPVTFRRDSLQLVGMLHVPAGTSQPAPAVLMLHGFTGNKAETHFLYTRLARQLATQGIAALRFDFAGSGDSQGEFADMTILTELADARAALDFLRQLPQVDAENIGLLGFSLGGCVAVLLASEGPAFKTMVLWAPVAKPAETFAYIPNESSRKEFGGRPVYDRGGYYIGDPFMETLAKVKPLEVATRISAPVLIIQGTADTSLRVSTSKAFYDIFERNNPASILAMLDGSGHTFSSLEFTESVTRLSLSWFSKFLLREGE